MRVTALDQVRLGSQVAAVKGRLSQAQWKQIVQYAHSRGFSVAGALSGNPDPLKERTQNSLKQQAAKTIAAVYQPAEGALDQQAQRLQNIDQKRQADNAVYRQWLMDQQTKYEAAARQSESQYQGYLQGLQQTTEQQHQNAQQQAIQAVQNAPGTVSDMKQSTALQGLSADTTRATGLVGTQIQKTAELIPSMESNFQAERQGIIGQSNAAEAKRQSDLSTGLDGINQDRLKLLSSQASDQLKEFQRLQGQQVDIANSNRNFGAAAQKLDIAQGTLNLKAKSDKQNFALKKQSLSIQKAKIKFGYDKLRQDVGQKEADRQFKQYLIKNGFTTSGALQKKPGAGGKGKSPTAAVQKTSVVQVQTIGNAVNILRRLTQENPGGDVIRNGANKGKTFRRRLAEQGYAQPIIDLAGEIQATGKLSPAGIRKAKALGIVNPQQLYGGK